MSRRWSELSSKQRTRIRGEVFSRKGRRCWQCGRWANTVDHIVPDSAGGAHTLDNLRPACRQCNSARQASASGDGVYGCRVVVVLGNSVEALAYAAQRAAWDDTIVDPLTLAQALAVPRHPARPAYLAQLGAELATAAAGVAARVVEPVTVWLIHPEPPRRAERADWLRRGWSVVRLQQQAGDLAEVVTREW